MDELYPAVAAAGLRERMETRMWLTTTLSALAAGEEAELTPFEIAERLARDHHAQEGDPVWGVAQGLRALGNAIKWEPAVAEADANPERFRNAARHLAGKALIVDRRGAWNESLVQALSLLAGLDHFDDVRRSAALLDRAPLPAPVTTLLGRRHGWNRPAVAHDEEAGPSVLLRFTLDGEPVSWPMAVNTRRAYRLGVVAKVGTWPANAERLVIDFESALPPSVIALDPIEIPRGEESGEAFLVLKFEIGPNESVRLTPAVSFRSGEGARRASVVGQRSLLVTTFDPSALGLGQPMVAQRILDLLAELDARIPTLPDQDRRDFVLLLDATTRFAALAIERDDLCGLDERGFQAKLKQAFVQDRTIGRRIQEASKLGAGTTDLVLGRIVDELKVEHDGFNINAADRYIRQPTQYASAGDCPIAVLTILDESSKSDPPGVQSNYMRWAYPRLHGATTPGVPSMVAIVIIPIGFPIPSGWSDRKKGDVVHGD
jgi:hypothetical protein